MASPLGLSLRAATSKLPSIELLMDLYVLQNKYKALWHTTSASVTTLHFC